MGIKLISQKGALSSGERHNLHEDRKKNKSIPLMKGNRQYETGTETNLSMKMALRKSDRNKTTAHQIYRV